MKIHIEFDTDNASFYDEDGNPAINAECESIFLQLQRKNWEWKQDYPILDANGNSIGKTWSEKEKEANQVS